MVYDAEHCARNAEADARNDPGMCLQQTRIWCGIPALYGDATDAWRNTNHRHGDRNPPRGAPVWWTGGSSGHGHIALSLGNGKVRSTDAGGSGHVATVDLGWVEAHWHLTYAGWSEDINEVAIPGLGDSHDTTTVMHGIDVSHYQAGLELAKTGAEFVIIKATEGTTVTDSALSRFVGQARDLAMPYGVYHFARGGGQVEADHFLDHVGAYVGEAVLVLDWETDVADTAGAKAFLDRVYQRTGIRPWIYMSQSVANTYDWSAIATHHALWAARYNTELGPTGPWAKPAAWQYTSSAHEGGYTVDADRFYGNAAAWEAYATGRNPDHTGGGLLMPDVTRYRRTDNTTVPADGGWHQLNLVNNDQDQTYSMATGPTTVHAVAYLQPIENDVWARYEVVDHKAGETAKFVAHSLKVKIPRGGGQIIWYDRLGTADKQLADKGWKRKLRIQVEAPDGKTQLNDVRLYVATAT